MMSPDIASYSDSAIVRLSDVAKLDNSGVPSKANLDALDKLTHRLRLNGERLNRECENTLAAARAEEIHSKHVDTSFAEVMRLWGDMKVKIDAVKRYNKNLQRRPME